MPSQNRVFVGCTGQGDKSVFTHAGRPYWDSSPAFREKLYQAEEWFPGTRIIELAVYENDQNKLVPTEVAQPLAYSLALASAAALTEQGEKAFRWKNTIYGGQSIGTGAAGALAKGYDETFGARMIGERSALMHQACQKTKGKMVVLIIHPESISAIEAVCAEYGAEIGNYNSPSQVVLTGKIRQVDRAVEKINEQKLARRVIPLLTEGAFHHRESMAPMVEPCRKWLDQNMPEEFQPESVIIGNQGQIIDSREAAIDELADGIANPSRFRAVMDTAFTKLGAKRAIECGPAKVIEAMVKDYQSTLQKSPSRKLIRIALGITVVTAATFLAASFRKDAE
jgi:malonyl CoA-acyl carrier protein transacylase